MTYNITIQQRKTRAQFTASNDVIPASTLCIETDTNVYTTGDGTSSYRAIRGNTDLNADERRSADDLYASLNAGAKMYTAYLSQDGTTDAATATVGTNEIGNISWTRGASKECVGTLSGAFPAGTVVMVSTGVVSAEYCFPIECKAVPSDTVSFLMYSPSEGDTMDGWDANVLIIVP